jgi:hypothetical protein
VSEDFGAKLSRWSQRKAATRRGAPVEEADADVRRDDEASDRAGPVNAPAVAGIEGDPAADGAVPTLPPIEELTAESDYTVFLAENVPEMVKRAALRKLWSSDPVLANIDGLNDYDEDYNLASSLITSVRTAYKVGKGYVDEAEEKLAQVEGGGGDELGEATERPPIAATEENKNDAPVDDADAAARHASAGDDDPESDGAVPGKAI